MTHQPIDQESTKKEWETVFEIGQRVNVYTEEDRFICVGAVDGIHYPESPGGEEFYDVQPIGTPAFGRLHRISEMRLTEVDR